MWCVGKCVVCRKVWGVEGSVQCVEECAVCRGVCDV